MGRGYSPQNLKAMHEPRARQVTKLGVMFSAICTCETLGHKRFVRENPILLVIQFIFVFQQKFELACVS